MPRKFSDRILLACWRLSGRTVTRPSCRACGYPIEGVESAKCPECGADRAIVGTIEPLPPVRLPIVMIVAAWWVIVATIAWATRPLVAELLPRDISYNEDCTLTPHSHLYGPFKIRRIGYGTGFEAIGPWPKHVDGATTWENPLSAFGGHFLTEMSVNPRRQNAGPWKIFASYAITKYTGPDATGAVALPPQMGEFDGTFVLGWLERMEIDTSRPDVRAEADEIAALMLAPDFTPEVYRQLSHFDVSVQSKKAAGSTPPKWSWWLPIALWATIAILGTMIILRRRRRRDVQHPPKPSVLV